MSRHSFTWPAIGSESVLLHVLFRVTEEEHLELVLDRVPLYVQIFKSCISFIAVSDRTCTGRQLFC